ncbi:MAG TPA: hemolysin D [Planctomycetaceae bacterium]|nr:hemolysin D [Planctomycetaceae bacterium]HRF00717.1 HlyD family efflux transporter periplasmic adaptor subunit [Pirellulaceae bacterium]
MSAAGLVSSTSRPLRLRLRSDLAFRLQHYHGRRYWVVKDSLTLRYFRFEEEEYSLLSWLDGRTSLEQLRRRFESRFAPQRISSTEIHQFIGRMFRQSLLVAEARGQGRVLLKRRDESRRGRWKKAFSGLLALRFRGIDPDRLLGRLEPIFGPLFTIPAAIVALGLMLAALSLVAIEAEQVAEKLPKFREFFGPSNWIWLAVTLSLTKVIHELGHGIACRRFGGRCHELGLMLLLFMPCLYCNVTDSWMIPGKWRRATVSAAGMYVELILASICTFLWWFSTPGLLNTLCLNVMFVGSVTTLLFNANPLMKYDGYYILSDLIEVPNLRQKASVVMQRWFLATFLGIRQAPDPFLPQRRRFLFGLYAVAAVAYRWLITASILAFLYGLLEPYGLKVVGQGLIIAGLYGLAIRPIVTLVRFLFAPGRWAQVKRLRAFASATLVIASLVALLATPLPYYLTCGMQLRSADAATVFVDSPGRIVEILVAAGDRVDAGAPLLRLENDRLRQDLDAAYGSWQSAESLLQQTRDRTRVDDTAWDLVPSLEESARIMREHHDRLLAEVDRLVIRAPRSGVVLAPADRIGERNDPLQLPTWQGSPLDDRNLGAWLDPATLVCQIGDPSRLEAVLAVEQEQLEFVSPQRQVELLLPHQNGAPIPTKVARIAGAKMTTVPAALDLRNGGTIAVENDAQGKPVPVRSTFEVTCPIDRADDRMALGETGTARIHAGHRSIAQRLVRYLRQTFTVEL